jgi:GWxTD domain-containing protein
LKRIIAPPFAVAALLLAGLLAAEEKMTTELSRWLEDVTPILTKAERAVFAKLPTNADRAKFVRLFWRMRDPFPDTNENEFQKEYEERIRFADQNFGHFSPKRGSQTDRGYFYLVLGPPRERQQFSTSSAVWPLELWFYQGDTEHGLPDHFYLIFYQPEGLGDFRLYSPTVEGPEKLAVPALGSGVAVNRKNVLTAIRNVSGELAHASLSYLPGETPVGMASFSSDNLIASIRGLPDKKFSDGYARSYLAYKDHVETEYMDRYFACAFHVGVFREAGQSFVHWSIEPEKMDFGTQGGSIYAGFELVLRVEDRQGVGIYERTEEIPIRITSQQFQEHARQRFAFQDLLAVVPGEYKALFLLKNKTARTFSSFETPFSVPPVETAGRPALGKPVLYYARSPVPEAQKGNLKAFAFGGQQYLVGARNEFLPSSTLGVFVQAGDIVAAGSDGGPSFVLEIVSAETNESAGTFPLTEVAPDTRDAASLLVSGTVPLKDIKPGYFRAEVSLRSPDGQTVLAAKENFVVLAQPAPVVPWVYARLHGAFPGPEHFKVLAAQHFLKGEYAGSRAALERVLADRDDPDARLLLAKSLYGLGLFKESLAHAVAVHERAKDRESAKVIALDHAGLKDWSAALPYLERLLAEATEVSVLNLAAECHLALGKADKALPLIEKSLALLPDQPAVKALEEQTRKRLGLR